MPMAVKTFVMNILLAETMLKFFYGTGWSIYFLPFFLPCIQSLCYILDTSFAIASKASTLRQSY